MTVVVTIGICVRNCEKYIEDAIKSVVNQDFSKNETEIIFVDDNSTDRTLEIIKDFASKTEIKTKVFHQSRKGLGASRNVVVKNADGQYIIWLDGDMKLPRDHVRKQVEYMDRNPKVGVARARYGFVKSKKLAAVLENSRAFDLRLNNPKLVGTGGSIHRVDAIREAGGFDESIKGAGEDIDALIRMLKNGWLLSTTNAKFYEQFKETWSSLWLQYYWWGYGAHYVQHKHKKSISVVTRLPPVAFFLGILRFFRVYRFHRKTTYLLLPLHNAFKETAWCVGFFKSHVDGYGDKKA